MKRGAERMELWARGKFVSRGEARLDPSLHFMSGQFSPAKDHSTQHRIQDLHGIAITAR